MRITQLPAHARVVKAHGAGNSFVVATDRHDDYDPSVVEVATLCSPAFGIGADGFIRAVERDGMWFMDYRNADGSKAEMCGNGVRVFVDHLRREGLVDLPVGQTLDVATRGGIKRVTPESEDEGRGASYRVDMGAAASPARATIKVTVPGIEGVLDGIWVDMPNPHTVVELTDEASLRAVFLPTVDVSQIPTAQRPSYDPEPQAGTNLELVVDLTEPGDERGHIAMRVLERGVGETQACGTGCCAAALATALRRGPEAPTQWVVDIPGGTVVVGLDGVVDWTGEGPRITEASVFLTGPATRVAEIRLP